MAAEQTRAPRVLIGFDGSDCAQAAIRGLRRAGLPDRAEALVLSVADLVVADPYGSPVVGETPAIMVPPSVVERAQSIARETLAAAGAMAERGAGMLRELFPGWKVRGEAVAGSPYWELIARSAAWSADLVVVGSHGRSALGRLVLGSVSQNVLSHADSSVRIGRSGPETQAGADPDRPIRLLLAVDGSPDSDRAVGALAGRTWPTGTEVRVLTVVDARLATSTGLMMTGMPGGPVADLNDAADEHVNAAAARLREAGLSAMGFVRDGDPKRVIVDEAERAAVDCIFLGARGHTRLERFLLGSVSSAVASRAHCSVEVVRGH